MKRFRLLVIAICALTTALSLHGVLHVIEWARPLTLAIVKPGSNITPAQRALRPIYPYSVIAGGAYSPAELRRAISKDPVVQNHYADFDINSTRVVTLATARFQYVSFRMKDKVYWTKHKLRIPEGETLLTDGKHFARTRCGNRLDSTPQGETAPVAPKALSLPPFTPQLLAQNELSLPAAPTIAEIPTEGLQFGLPQQPPYVPPALPAPEIPIASWPPIPVLPTPSGPAPIVPGKPLVPASPTPPVFQTQPPFVAEVPEPATLYLFIAALALSLWIITRWIREDSGVSGNSTEDGS